MILLYHSNIFLKIVAIINTNNMVDPHPNNHMVQNFYNTSTLFAQTVLLHTDPKKHIQ